jgi:hypothetical protein
MHAAALAHLEKWLSDVRDPDPEQRAWKQAYGDGATLAFERLGLISPEEAQRWRARFREDVPALPPEPALDAPARSAAAEYIAMLVERVKPLRREPDDEVIRGGVECATAIEALYAVGALDAGAYDHARARLLAAQAPWLDEPVPPPADGRFFAIEVPPETEEQAAEDAAQAAALAARPAARGVRRIVLGSPERHNGLAIVALVAHEDVVGLHFHYLGDRQRNARAGLDSLDAFDQTLEGLRPPTLTDEIGTAYEPIDRRPSSAGGAGGMPDPERREAITGFWLYTPSAPDAVHAFEVRRGGDEWHLRGVVS